MPSQILYTKVSVYLLRTSAAAARELICKRAQADHVRRRSFYHTDACVSNGSQPSKTKSQVPRRANKQSDNITEWYACYQSKYAAAFELLVKNTCQYRQGRSGLRRSRDGTRSK